MESLVLAAVGGSGSSSSSGGAHGPSFLTESEDTLQRITHALDAGDYDSVFDTVATFPRTDDESEFLAEVLRAVQDGDAVPPTQDEIYAYRDGVERNPRKCDSVFEFVLACKIRLLRRRAQAPAQLYDKVDLSDCARFIGSAEVNKPYLNLLACISLSPMDLEDGRTYSMEDVVRTMAAVCHDRANQIAVTMRCGVDAVYTPGPPQHRYHIAFAVRVFQSAMRMLHGERVNVITLLDLHTMGWGDVTRPSTIIIAGAAIYCTCLRGELFGPFTDPHDAFRVWARVYIAIRSRGHESELTWYTR